MRHDWIFDVLSDLHSYASANDMPELARKVEEALVIARLEIGALSSQGNGNRVIFRARRRVH